MRNQSQQEPERTAIKLTIHELEPDNKQRRQNKMVLSPYADAIRHTKPVLQPINSARNSDIIKLKKSHSIVHKNAWTRGSGGNSPTVH